MSNVLRQIEILCKYSSFPRTNCGICETLNEPKKTPLLDSQFVYLWEYHYEMRLHSCVQSSLPHFASFSHHTLVLSLLSLDSDSNELYCFQFYSFSIVVYGLYDTAKPMMGFSPNSFCLNTCSCCFTIAVCCRTLHCPPPLPLSSMKTINWKTYNKLFTFITSYYYVVA